MKSLFSGLLKALKLPVKLLKVWIAKRKKSTKRDELEKKLRTRLWNFSPGRLKNVSIQKSSVRQKFSQ
ncbi:MAG: hypothetical protein MRERC_7c089 [Mycoplasmataceae bacterium RC_NB112A]|nr:MAG: hypothetical protein MRERC_9c004 [Mycoplasmataceae bacterium RC_NB112A]KLL01919.1 MAG: hypothetical protein MRERC_7c089 [Mycoplasmataceae bacterium RC_NB112A]